MLRFGLFGTGYWAATVHGAALAVHPEAKLVGVWGRDPAKAAALAERYGASAFDDVDALIDQVDAVAVALPPDVQAGIAVRAARAGRHLLLDKPLALSTVQAQQLVTAAEQGEVASIVFFTRRFQPDVASFLGAAVAAGGWHGVHATMFSSIFQPGSPYAGSRWRREHGGLWDIGPHALSLILPVLGPAAQVTAVDGPRDTVHLMLTHAGAVSNVSLTLDAAPAAAMNEIVFYGEHGVERVPDGRGSALEAFALAIDQLLEQVVTGARDHQCDVRFGHDVVTVLAAAELARSQGRTINLAGAGGAGQIRLP